MSISVLGVGLVSMLAVLVLPVPRVRQFLFTATTRLAQTALFALLGACGTFLVTPESAPAWTGLLMAPVVELTATLFGPNAHAGLPWLVLALLAFAVTLPVLMALELAVDLTRQTELVTDLRAELRSAEGWVDSRLSALGVTRTPMPRATEAAAAAEAFRDKGQKANSGPLVMDLMNK